MPNFLPLEGKIAPKWEPLLWAMGQQTFPVKGQQANILGFADHMVSETILLFSIDQNQPLIIHKRMNVTVHQ